MINLGVIGMGGIAKGLHVPMANSSGKFFVKAASDAFGNDERAKLLNIPDFYTDYRDLLKDPEIDAVLIASPHDCHEENCIAAFEAGKHIIVEKPISRNLREAKNIMEAAKKAGTIGMIGFCERFYPTSVYIKNALDENKLGKLLSANIDHYQNFNPAPDSWWRDTDKVGGGAVIGSGVHRLDLLRWYFGETKSVYAKGVSTPQRLSAEACVHSVIEFESGVIANFSINWASYNYLYYEALTITGENGLVITGNGDKIGLSHIDNGQLKDFKAPPCQTMYEHFAECIEKNIQPLTSLEEGYKSLQLVRAIYKSMETGQIIDPRTVNF